METTVTLCSNRQMAQAIVQLRVQQFLSTSEPARGQVRCILGMIVSHKLRQCAYN